MQFSMVINDTLCMPLSEVEERTNQCNLYTATILTDELIKY